LLQESWSPDDGGPSTAARVAEALDYRVVEEVALAHGRLFDPVFGADDGWGPLKAHASRALHLDGERRKPSEADRERGYRRGSWGIALLSRMPSRDGAVILLGQLSRDPARRAAITATFDLAGGPLAFFGTHMSHITQGSHLHYRLLASRLPPPAQGAVLVGDMNLWGPPVGLYFRGWRRVVTGRTWPAPHPHSQLDHVLTTPPVMVTDGRVSGELGSDHRAVTVTVAL
jgi:endonuclease/exonuclease/phosphatase family metal-dependent hydrolase